MYENKEEGSQNSKTYMPQKPISASYSNHKIIKIKKFLYCHIHIMEQYTTYELFPFDGLQE